MINAQLVKYYLYGALHAFYSLILRLLSSETKEKP